MQKQYNEPIKGLLILIITVLFLTLFLIVSSMFTSKGYKDALAALQTDDVKQTVVIDAGHGGEDPGAVANGVIEKEVNLKIAYKLRDMLVLNGYNVVLTRETDNLLYTNPIVVSKKNDDLVNRAKYTQAPDVIFVSIHCNKFGIERYNGLQTFYSDNNDGGYVLAEYIQSSVKSLIDATNYRQVKCGDDTIYILNHSICPTVLVECGFISNKTEAQMLISDDYQSKLALAVYLGISSYMEANT